MKKLMTAHVVLLYLCQLVFLAGTIVSSVWAQTETPLPDSEIAFKALIYCSAGIGFIALIMSFIIIITGLFQIGKPIEGTYKATMLYKTTLIPFFVVNFALCAITILVMMHPLLLYFLGTFFLAAVFIVLPSSIILTYISMLATSINSIGYMLNKVIYGKQWILILHIVLHLVFVADVVSSVVVYSIDKKKQLDAAASATE